MASLAMGKQTDRDFLSLCLSYAAMRMLRGAPHKEQLTITPYFLCLHNGEPHLRVQLSVRNDCTLRAVTVTENTAVHLSPSCFQIPQHCEAHLCATAKLVIAVPERLHGAQQRKLTSPQTRHGNVTVHLPQTAGPNLFRGSALSAPHRSAIFPPCPTSHIHGSV
jgi:hypothetical protein